MRKSIIIFLTIFFFSFSVFAYLSEHSLYINKNLGIKFTIPKNWIKSETNDFTPVKLTLYNHQGGYFSFVVSSKNKFNLDKWVRNLLKEKVFKKKKIIIKKKSIIKIAGTKAYRIDGYKKNKKFTMIFLIHKSKGFIISYSCNPKQIYTSKKQKNIICAKLSKDFLFLISRIYLF